MRTSKSAMGFRRAAIVVIALLYAVVFHVVYRLYLAPVFGYIGFARVDRCLGVELIVSALAIVPAFWLPTGIQRATQVIYLFLYVTVYVPSCLVPFYVEFQDDQSLVRLVSALAGGFAILGMSYLFPLVKIAVRPISRPCFLVLGWTTVAALTTCVVAAFWGRFRFVAFDDIYANGVRSEGMAIASQSLVRYAMMLLGGACFPVLIARGIAKSSAVYVATGLMGDAMLYGTAGQKAYLLCPAMVGATYLLYRKGRQDRFTIRLLGVAGFGCLFLYFAYATLGTAVPGVGIVCAIVFMRTLGWPGLATAMYGDYFSTHPLTYLSHVGAIGKVIPYPYDTDPGHLIAYYFTGNPALNANAHFWAADGIAGFGLIGLLVMSGLAAAVFWLFDCLAAKQERGFAVVVSVYPAFVLSNASLFTGILSGGIGLIMAVLLVSPMSRKDRP